MVRRLDAVALVAEPAEQGLFRTADGGTRQHRSLRGTAGRFASHRRDDAVQREIAVAAISSTDRMTPLEHAADDAGQAGERARARTGTGVTRFALRSAGVGFSLDLRPMH